MGTEGAPVVVAAAAAWSAIARKDAVVPEPTKVVTSAVRSRSGLSTLVVDANAIIGGGTHLLGVADRFFTVREVLEEVRDPQSRMQLAALPLTLEVLEPDAEAMTKVVQFSRATGDLQSLSEVDLKLIALAYTLEGQVHGTSHLRTRPPPLQVTPVQNHRIRDPPGWGKNVSNLKEWEELPEEENRAAKSNVGNQSKILGLKYLNLDGKESEKDPAYSNHEKDESGEGSVNLESEKRTTTTSMVGLENVKSTTDPTIIESDVSTSTGNEGQRESRSGYRGGRSRREKPAREPKPVVNIEGKLNVAVGLDASKTEPEEEEDSSDWMRACSRTTRRKYLKREARRQARAAIPESSPSVAGNETSVLKEESQKGFFDEDVQLPSVDEVLSEEIADMLSEDAEGTEDKHVAHVQSDGVIRQEESVDLTEESGKLLEEDENRGIGSDCDEEDTRAFAAELAAHEASGGIHCEDDEKESIAGTEPSTQADSEQSWSLRPLWQSTVACATGDFAMQNVILQMGLRLLSPTGVHVRELHRWVLKCTACGKITPEVGRIFCPKCGNGGTLYKVSVTVGANGTLHAGRIRRVNLRGTRYSLPKPKGGRQGAAENPILREDQLPHRVLHPKQKKLPADGDAFVTMDTVFLDNKAQMFGKSPQVQQAAAVYGGRRNPNERRVARKH